MKYTLAQLWSMRHECREKKEKKKTYKEIANIVSRLGHGPVKPADVSRLDKENLWSNYGFGVTTGITTAERSVLLGNQKIHS